MHPTHYTPPPPPTPTAPPELPALAKFRVWLKDRLQSHRRALAEAPNPDHPRMDHDRISAGTLQRVAAELVMRDLAPGNWMLPEGAAAITHGMVPALHDTMEAALPAAANMAGSDFGLLLVLNHITAWTDTALSEVSGERMERVLFSIAGQGTQEDTAFFRACHARGTAQAAKERKGGGRLFAPDICHGREVPSAS